LKVYEAKWLIFEKCCKQKRLNPLAVSPGLLADFFLHLFVDKKLAPITIKGYRSAISRIYRMCGLPDPGQDQDLSKLVNNFTLERPKTVQLFPKWSLDVVLDFLNGEPFEPLEQAFLKHLTWKTVFLVTLATAGRVSEVHALSARSDCLRFNQDGSVSLLTTPGFLAKNRLPEWGAQGYTLQPLPDSLLCPVRALESVTDGVFGYKLLFYHNSRRWM
jgi:hypothetical protein